MKLLYLTLPFSFALYLALLLLYLTFPSPAKFVQSVETTEKMVAELPPSPLSRVIAIGNANLKASILYFLLPPLFILDIDYLASLDAFLILADNPLYAASWHYFLLERTASVIFFTYGLYFYASLVLYMSSLLLKKPLKLPSPDLRPLLFSIPLIYTAAFLEVFIKMPPVPLLYFSLNLLPLLLLLRLREGNLFLPLKLNVR